jgi:hypothetical protein
MARLTTSPASRRPTTPSRVPPGMAASRGRGPAGRHPRRLLHHRAALVAGTRPHPAAGPGVGGLPPRDPRRGHHLQLGARHTPAGRDDRPRMVAAPVTGPGPGPRLAGPHRPRPLPGLRPQVRQQLPVHPPRNTGQKKRSLMTPLRLHHRPIQVQLDIAGGIWVDACRTIGTGRRTGYRWRAENGGLPARGDPWPDGRERAWSPSVSSPAGAGPLSLFERPQHAPGRDGIQRAAARQRRLDEPAHDPQTSWAGAKRLINTQAVTSMTVVVTCSGTRNASAAGPARPATVPGGYSGFFGRSGESATCRVEEPVLGEWCLGWSIDHPGMDCLNQGPRVLP